MDNFSRTLLKEWERLRETTMNDVTLWDAFTSLVQDKAPLYILVLKADLFLLEHIAKGFSIASIHRITGVPSKAIRKVAFTWGFEPLEETLDFDALLVYNRGMTAEQLAFKMNELLPIPLELSIYDRIIYNIERYMELQNIVEEEDQ